MTAHVVVKIVASSELEKIITIIYHRLVLRTQVVIYRDAGHCFHAWA